MKYLTLSVLFLALIGCANNNSKPSEAAQQSEQKAPASDQQLQEVTLKIEGMTCAHGCAATIEKNPQPRRYSYVSSLRKMCPAH